MDLDMLMFPLGHIGTCDFHSKGFGFRVWGLGFGV